MTRCCNGQDENLIMHVDAKTGERIEGIRKLDEIEKPCNCGLMFNDERRSTVFPHHQI